MKLTTIDLVARGIYAKDYGPYTPVPFEKAFDSRRAECDRRAAQIVKAIEGIGGRIVFDNPLDQGAVLTAQPQDTAKNDGGDSGPGSSDGASRHASPVQQSAVRNTRRADGSKK